MRQRQSLIAGTTAPAFNGAPSPHKQRMASDAEALRQPGLTYGEAEAIEAITKHRFAGIVPDDLAAHLEQATNHIAAPSAPPDQIRRLQTRLTEMRAERFTKSTPGRLQAAVAARDEELREQAVAAAVAPAWPHPVDDEPETRIDRSDLVIVALAPDPTAQPHASNAPNNGTGPKPVDHWSTVSFGDRNGQVLLTA